MTLTPFVDDGDFALYVGDVLDVLRDLPDESVHCCVTSPPYWGLRDYGTGEWDGGDPDCDHRDARRSEERAARKFTDGRGQTGNSLTSWTYRDETVKAADCPKGCGARRVDRQIGLEPTPDAYVARMVDVFREVRRVLRADGTLWLNLGDSYASSPKGNPDALSAGLTNGGRHQAATIWHRTRSTIVDGLKSKDLVGIPWAVAKALQESYYTGRIKDERDRIWLAAMVDAEGCMFIHKRKIGQSNGQGYVRKTDSYGAGLEVASTDRAIVDRCLAIAGKGSIGVVERGTDARRRQTLYRWMLRSNECRDIIRELYPHFVAKQHEARLVLGCPSSGDDAAKAHESLKAIHQGRPPVIDFAAPASLYEPGWYLRSDVIWFKSNPMPESVTDRPTKAHEYVFMLTRSPRYFFDADAVREPSLEVSIARAGRARLTPYAAPGQTPQRRDSDADGLNPAGRNIRSVWEIATQPYAEAHFATFPLELPRRCIAAGTSERGCCPVCGAPWEREIEREPSDWGMRKQNGEPMRHGLTGAASHGAGGFAGVVAV